MQGNIPPKLLKRLECKRLLERLGFSLEISHAMVCDNDYDTTKKLSYLKPNNVDILVKTLCSPDREHKDRTKDPRISMPHSSHWLCLIPLSLLQSTSHDQWGYQAKFLCSIPSAGMESWSQQQHLQQKPTQVGCSRPRAVLHKYPGVLWVPLWYQQGSMLLHALQRYCSPCAQKWSNRIMGQPQQEDDQEVSYYPYQAAPHFPNVKLLEDMPDLRSPELS